MPIRIQRSRQAGWRKPAGAIIVTRPSMFSNPFPVSIYGQDGAVEMFRRWWDQELTAHELQHAEHVPMNTLSLSSRRHMAHTNMRVLRGKDLCCWCSLEVKCHADILLQRANA